MYFDVYFGNDCKKLCLEIEKALKDKELECNLIAAYSHACRIECGDERVRANYGKFRNEAQAVAYVMFRIAYGKQLKFVKKPCKDFCERLERDWNEWEEFAKYRLLSKIFL